MIHCHQISREDRYMIRIVRRVLMQSQIATNLIRHKATISWCITHNYGLRGYRCRQANILAADLLINSRIARQIEASD